MTDKWDDKLFSRWISLRGKFRSAKREKDYCAIISTCNEILELNERARFIGIMKALFEYEIAEAHKKLDDTKLAIKYYKLAVKSFEVYRSEKPLNKPDDFLSDIQKIQKKLTKLAAE